MIDFSALTMTEIIRLQSQLGQELTRRFERHMVLMFSDIVGSTQYFSQFGDAAGRELQQLHVDLLGHCLAASQGRIVDTADDGAFCAFATADAAVQAIVELSQRMARENASRSRQHQLQVRIGMHWGSVLTDGVVVSGETVNLSARVAASAQAGEVRLTREVFQELSRAHRLACSSLGTVPLKGVAQPVEVLAFEWRDEASFPRRLRVEETREEITLPQQDIVTFGRLTEHDGMRANDVVLKHPEPELSRRISRWHFELRRHADGLRLRALSDSTTQVDGALVDKGVDVPVRSGSSIRVAEVLTLCLVGAREQDADSTSMVRRPP